MYNPQTTELKLWFIEYWKKPNNYANKIVKAHTAEEAVFKSRLKHIEDVTEITEKYFSDVNALVKRYEREGR